MSCWFTVSRYGQLPQKGGHSWRARKTSAHRWLPGIAAGWPRSCPLPWAVAAVASPAVAARLPLAYRHQRHSSARIPDRQQRARPARRPAPLPPVPSPRALLARSSGAAGLAFPLSPAKASASTRPARNGSSGWADGSTTYRDNGRAVPWPTRNKESARTSRRVTRSFPGRWPTQRAPRRAPRPPAPLLMSCLAAARCRPPTRCGGGRSRLQRLAQHFGQVHRVPGQCSDGASPSNLIADAVCGHKPVGYKIVSDSFTLGPQSLLLDGLTCPSGTSALDGGTQVPGHAPAVQISGSIDEGHLGWAVAVNNTGLATEQEHSYVICAA